jgi:hypothetical protein
VRASSCDHTTGGEVLEGGSDRRWLSDKGQREEGVQICLRSFAVRGGNEGIWKQCIVFSAYSGRCSAGDYDHSESRMEGVAADNPQEGGPRRPSIHREAHDVGRVMQAFMPRIFLACAFSLTMVPTTIAQTANAGGKIPATHAYVQAVEDMTEVMSRRTWRRRRASHRRCRGPAPLPRR